MFGLTFLNAGVLAFLAAAVIPLLIYLFIRKKPQRIIFSSIKFIRESQKKQKQKININNLLLLIIRILIILLLIFALARPSLNLPFLHTRTTHPPTAVAIIIDSSYSMDYLADTRTDLEKAKEIASEINMMLTENDMTVGFTSDEKWNEIYSVPNYGRLPERFFSNVEVTPLPLKLNSLISSASTVLKESQLKHREIYVITDFRRQELDVDTSIPVYFIPTSDNEEKVNLSIQNARIEEDFVQRRNQKKIIFDVVNHSSLVQQDIICQLILNEITVAEKAVTLNPFQRKQEEMIFEIDTTEDNWYFGYVQIENDRLQYDNRNYFSFHFNLNPKVGVLTKLNRLPLVLESVLEIYVNDPADIEYIQSPVDTHEKLMNYDFIVLYQFDYSQRLEFILDQLKNREKRVIYISDQNLSMEWKNHFESKFSLQFAEFISSDKERTVNISYLNPYHPITDLLDFDNIRSYNLTDTWEVRSLGFDGNILFQAGSALIAVEKGNAQLWLFDPDSLKNYFLVDYSFPLFAYRSFLYSADILVPNYSVGDIVRGNYDRVIDPENREISIVGNRINLENPGIYRLLSAEAIRYLPVNILYHYSDYTRFDTEKDKNVTFLDENWQDGILTSHTGREVWKYLFLLVLLLFILEMIIIKKSENKIQ